MAPKLIQEKNSENLINNWMDKKKILKQKKMKKNENIINYSKSIDVFLLVFFSYSFLRGIKREGRRKEKGEKERKEERGKRFKLGRRKNAVIEFQKILAPNLIKEKIKKNLID